MCSRRTCVRRSRSVGASRDADRLFAAALVSSVASLMERTGLRFDVPSKDIGAMLAVVVTGSIARLGAGADPESVEEAYALAWLGLLSLTVPV